MLSDLIDSRNAYVLRRKNPLPYQAHQICRGMIPFDGPASTAILAESTPLPYARPIDVHLPEERDVCHRNF
jgi:hypothetical protein